PGLVVSNSEIRLNSASAGGGLWIVPGAGDVLLVASIVCENEPDQISGSFTDGGGNDLCDDCFGDLTGDGFIDGADLGAMLGFWGVCPSGACSIADLTGDGLVDGADLSLVLGGWGGCVPQ
ncbi:MAG: hypothetical protein ACO3Y3_07960, partial [Phycisphaerales bacterium]